MNARRWLKAEDAEQSRRHRLGAGSPLAYNLCQRAPSFIPVIITAKTAMQKYPRSAPHLIEKNTVNGRKHDKARKGVLHYPLLL